MLRALCGRETWGGFPRGLKNWEETAVQRLEKTGVLDGHDGEGVSAPRHMLARPAAADGRLLLVAHHSGCVNTVSFSPDGTLLASGSDDLQVAFASAACPPAPLQQRSVPPGRAAHLDRPFPDPAGCAVGLGLWHQAAGIRQRPHQQRVPGSVATAIGPDAAAPPSPRCRHRRWPPPQAPAAPTHPPFPPPPFSLPAQPASCLGATTRPW